MINKLNSFAFVLEPIFYRVVYMSIIASFIGIAILIIRKIFSKKISPKWISRLWFLVLIALVCPIQISSIFSIYNYIPKKDLVYNIPNISFREEYNISSQENHDILNSSGNNSKVEIQEVKQNSNIVYIKSLIVDVLLPYLWLIVASILIISYIITYINFALKLQKYENSTDRRLLFILERCKVKLKINTRIRIIEQNKIKTPSLFGIFNIFIIVPSNIIELTDAEIKYVFMHELSHFKRKDNLLKLCITLLKKIYFFNPIIYLIDGQIIKDIEIATDELAVTGFDQINKKEYCKTLVKLTNEYTEKSFVAKTLAISDDKSNLERRIKMVKLSNGFIKHKLLIAVVSMVIILALGCLFLTKPKVIDESKTNQGQVLSQAEALQLGKEKFAEMKDLYWSWRNYNVEGEGANLRIKEEHLNKIKSICTESAFKQFIEYWELSLGNDGYYYFSEGVGANPRYISDELTVESINENEIVFIDTVNYDDTPSIKNYKFVLVNVSGNWLINQFTSPF